MQVPRKRLFYLGLIVIASSVVFSIVTYYFPGYPIMGDVYTVTNLGEGRQEVIIVVSPRNNETRWEGYVYLRAPYPDYPLRQYHALSYVFLAIGLVLSFYSLRIKWNISPKLELTKHIIMGKKLWIVLLIGLIIGFGLGYSLIPKGRKTVAWRVLSVEEVRQLTLKNLDVWMGLELKPETLGFISLNLVQKAKVWVGEKPLAWVVEYRCDARGTGTVAVPINDSNTVPSELPFSPMLFRMEFNAYTGRMNYAEGWYSADLPPSSPFYRSVSIIEFRKSDNTLGSLSSTFSIYNFSKDTANMALTASFTSPDPTLLESVRLKTTLFIGMFQESILHAPLFGPPFSERNLWSWGSTVLAYHTYNLSAFDTPVVAVAYKVTCIELRFSNGSTILIGEFSQGRCKITSGATLNMTDGYIGGIAPIWEGDYEYSPSLVLYRLDELEGKDIWRKIIIDIDYGNYSMEKK